MSKTIIPKGYKSQLNLYETQTAIGNLKRAFEVSSMGIRVDEKSLDEQLTKADCDYRRELPFHKMLLQGELPLTVDGGIGQSRLACCF